MALSALAAPWRWAGEQTGYRAVRRDLLHLTAAFIGEVEIHRLAAIQDALRRLSRTAEPFVAPFGSIEALPGARRPRVLALGFGEDPSLAALSDEVAESLAQVAETPGLRKALERKSRPHVTLARWKGRGAPRPIDLAGAPQAGGELRVQRLELVQSVLGSAGPTHTMVEAFPLGEAV